MRTLSLAPIVAFICTNAINAQIVGVATAPDSVHKIHALELELAQLKEQSLSLSRALERLRFEGLLQAAEPREALTQKQTLGRNLNEQIRQYPNDQIQQSIDALLQKRALTYKPDDAELQRRAEIQRRYDELLRGIEEDRRNILPYYQAIHVRGLYSKSPYPYPDDYRPDLYSPYLSPERFHELALRSSTSKPSTPLAQKEARPSVITGGKRDATSTRLEAVAKAVDQLKDAIPK